MENLLSKFNNIEIKNDTRISDIDKKYCENQEEMYKEAIQAMKQTLELFKSIHEKTKGEERYSNNGYIDNYKDIRHFEDRLNDFKSEFIYKIISHFERSYNVTLRDSELKQKYDYDDVTYQDIVNEVFEQLGGFNFNEKAVNEIKEKTRSLIYRDVKVTVKKNKLSLNDFVWWDHTWDNKKRLGYSDSKVTPLFKGLSHFETESVDTLHYYSTIYNELYNGEEKHDIFSKFELGYNKILSLKFFKNGKLEIEFETNQQAKEFTKEYLNQII